MLEIIRSGRGVVVVVVVVVDVVVGAGVTVMLIRLFSIFGSMQARP